MKTRGVFAAAFALSLLTRAAAQTAEVADETVLFREWTSTVGTKIEAKLVSASGDKVKLLRLDGSSIEVPVNSLSAADQDYVRTKLTPPGTKQAAATSPASAGAGSATSAPPLPANFPKDPALESIPTLKRKRDNPIEYSFQDYITKKTITSRDLKGKYVYVYTDSFITTSNQTELAALKLLHDKYGPRGFTAIAIQYRRYSAEYQTKTRNNLEQAIKDYGISWYVTIPSKEGLHPLMDKFMDDVSLGWLLDPEGRLVHSNVHINSIPAAKIKNYTTVGYALGRIFGPE